MLQSYNIPPVMVRNPVPPSARETDACPLGFGGWIRWNVGGCGANNASPSPAHGHRTELYPISPFGNPAGINPQSAGFPSIEEAVRSSRSSQPLEINPQTLLVRSSKPGRRIGRIARPFHSPARVKSDGRHKNGASRAVLGTFACYLFCGIFTINRVVRLTTAKGTRCCCAREITRALSVTC